MELRLDPLYHNIVLETREPDGKKKRGGHHQFWVIDIEVCTDLRNTPFIDNLEEEEKPLVADEVSRAFLARPRPSAKKKKHMLPTTLMPLFLSFSLSRTCRASVRWRCTRAGRWTL